MGYETHIMVGYLNTENSRPEWQEDKNKPYEDGSGFPPLLDEEGNEVLTGRLLTYFSVYAEMNLCKIYDSCLFKLHDKYKKTPMLAENQFVYVYMKDGNTEFIEDSYGDRLVVVPFLEALEAARKDAEKDKDGYRRFQWIKDLLESMQGSEDMKNELTCVFYGS